MEIERSAETGVIEGLSAAYNHRGWRPVLFPALGAPFFALAGGSLRAGIALTQFALVLVIGLYTLALARRYLPSGRALIAVAFILSLPWLIYFSMVFYAELAWIAFTAGWVYHTVASSGFRARRHTILSGVLLALMVCVRPIESVIVTTPAMMLFGWLAHRRRELQPGGFALACATAIVVAAAWWAPFLDELYAWAHETSFGPLALVTDQRFRGVSVWTLVRDVTSHYAPRQLMMLGVAATGLWVWHRGRSRPPLGLVAAGLVMAAPIIAVLMWTGTSSYRRMVPAMFVIFLGLVVALLHPAWRWPRARTIIMAILAGGQVGLVVLNGFAWRPAWLERTYASFSQISPASPTPDVAESIVRTLDAGGVVDGRIATYAWCYYDDFVGCSSRGMNWFESAALTAAAIAHRSGIRFHFESDLDVGEPARIAAQLRAAGYRYVLLDLYARDDLRTSQIPYLTVTSGLLAMLARDGHIPGLVPIRRYELGGRIVVLFEVAPDVVHPPSLESVAVTLMGK